MNNRQIYPDLADAARKKKKLKKKQSLFSIDSKRDKLRREKWSLLPNTKETSNKTSKKKRRKGRKMLVLINTNLSLLLPW